MSLGVEMKCSSRVYATADVDVIISPCLMVLLSVSPPDLCLHSRALPGDDMRFRSRPDLICACAWPTMRQRAGRRRQPLMCREYHPTSVSRDDQI